VRLVGYLKRNVLNMLYFLARAQLSGARYSSDLSNGYIFYIIFY